MTWRHPGDKDAAGMEVTAPGSLSPTRRDDTSTLVRFGNRLLGAIEDVLYIAVATLLATAASVVLFRAAIELFRSSQVDRPQAMLPVLDELLLVFIFVELLYAVRTTLGERRVTVEPFLIAGILAAIKEIIVLSVKAANEYLARGPEFARAMVEVGLLGAIVMILTVAAVLLRRYRHGVDEPPAAPLPRRRWRPRQSRLAPAATPVARPRARALPASYRPRWTRPQ